MPGRKAIGTNRANSTRVVARIGPTTSDMAFLAAALPSRPSSIFRSTFSTTTMASSTTRPTARTRPRSVKVLMEKPNRYSR